MSPEGATQGFHFGIPVTIHCTANHQWQNGIGGTPAFWAAGRPEKEGKTSHVSKIFRSGQCRKAKKLLAHQHWHDICTTITKEMKAMTKLAGLIATMALFPLGTAIYARNDSSQQPGYRPERQSQQTKGYEKEGKKNTLVGCLMPGTTDNTFVLRKKGSREEIPVEGSADLAQHVNQMVQIKGTMSEDNGRGVFKVKKLKQVGNSSSCAENAGSAANEKPSPARR